MICSNLEGEYWEYDMRHSKQRDQIYEIVKNTEEHPTADWIYERAREMMPAISLGTVYRNLGQLVDHGMIRSLEYKGAVRYDGRLEHHHHFVCKTCGRIHDVFFDAKKVIGNVQNKTEHIVDDIQKSNQIRLESIIGTR